MVVDLIIKHLLNSIEGTSLKDEQLMTAIILLVQLVTRGLHQKMIKKHKTSPNLILGIDGQPTQLMNFCLFDISQPLWTIGLMVPSICCEMKSNVYQLSILALYPMQSVNHSKSPPISPSSKPLKKFSAQAARFWVYIHTHIAKPMLSHLINIKSLPLLFHNRRRTAHYNRA